MSNVAAGTRRRTHSMADLVRRADRYRAVAARALSAFPPSVPKAYGRQPGVSRTGLSRAMHGDESNWLYRGLCHIAALAELGDGPDGADLAIGILRRERSRLWSELDSRDCALMRECEADTDEDRVMVAYLIGQASADDYSVALLKQAAASERLAACLRTGKLQNERTPTRRAI